MTATPALLGIAGASGAGSSLTVTASPPSWAGSRKFETSRTFGPSTLIPAGGSGSYTYAWSVITSDSSCDLSAPTSAACSFTISSPGVGFTSFNIVRGTVTDTVTSATAYVDVDISYTIIDNNLPEN